MQGIQNLMGALSDLDDFIHPYIPYITSTPTHSHPHPNAPPPHTIFTITSTTLLFLLLFLLPFIPMRAVALVVGLAPLGYTNPFMRGYVFPGLVSCVWEGFLGVLEDLRIRRRLWFRRGGKEEEGGEGGQGQGWSSKSIRALVARIMDDDRLEDRHWNTEMREVELWENERWSPTGSPSSSPSSLPSSNTNTNSDCSTATHGAGDTGAEGASMGSGGGGWGKGYLRGLAAERGAWTRGRDGWSGVGEDGSGEVRSVFYPLFFSFLHFFTSLPSPSSSTG
jgi:hypothetical protein